MQHEPSGFLCHSESAMQFVRANPIFAAHDEPQGGKPLLQRDRRILEYGADLERELLLGMFLVAAVDPRLFEIGNLLGAASRAAHLAIGPAHESHELAAVVEVAEEENCLLECLWAFHAQKVAGKLQSGKYIIANISGIMHLTQD